MELYILFVYSNYYPNDKSTLENETIHYFEFGVSSNIQQRQGNYGTSYRLDKVFIYNTGYKASLAESYMKKIAADMNLKLNYKNKIECLICTYEELENIYNLMFEHNSTSKEEPQKIENNINPHIEIPNSVKHIGNFAFSGCVRLTHIEIPNSVKTIGEGAFQKCTGLTHIVIPNSVKQIRQSAFYGCTSLTSIEIPNSVKKIGKSAFFDCTSLTHIVIPNSVTEIGAYAFYRCTSLTHVEISNSVKTIGWATFSHCTSLTNIVIPNSVTNIRPNAFSCCTSLTHVVIPNSVEMIGPCAFWYCISLTVIEIPNSVTEIGREAFFDCTSLTDIVIPNSVKTIGDSAFKGCTRLTHIKIHNSVTECIIVFYTDHFGETDDDRLQIKNLENNLKRSGVPSTCVFKIERPISDDKINLTTDTLHLYDKECGDEIDDWEKAMSENIFSFL